MLVNMCSQMKCNIFAHFTLTLDDIETYYQVLLLFIDLRAKYIYVVFLDTNNDIDNIIKHICIIYVLC